MKKIPLLLTMLFSSFFHPIFSQTPEPDPLIEWGKQMIQKIDSMEKTGEEIPLDHLERRKNIERILHELDSVGIELKKNQEIKKQIEKKIKEFEKKQEENEVHRFPYWDWCECPRKRGYFYFLLSCSFQGRGFLYAISYLKKVCYNIFQFGSSKIHHKIQTL